MSKKSKSRSDRVFYIESTKKHRSQDGGKTQ